MKNALLSPDSTFYLRFANLIGVPGVQFHFQVLVMHSFGKAHNMDFYCDEILRALRRWH